VSLLVRQVLAWIVDEGHGYGLRRRLLDTWLKLEEGTLIGNLVNLTIKALYVKAGLAVVFVSSRVRWRVAVPGSSPSSERRHRGMHRGPRQGLSGRRPDTLAALVRHCGAAMQITGDPARRHAPRFESPD
jgi:hypothetical protein